MATLKMQIYGKQSVEDFSRPVVTLLMDLFVLLADRTAFWDVRIYKTRVDSETDKCTTGATPLRSTGPSSSIVCLLVGGRGGVGSGGGGGTLRFTQTFQSFGEPGFLGCCETQQSALGPVDFPWECQMQGHPSTPQDQNGPPPPPRYHHLLQSQCQMDSDCCTPHSDSNTQASWFNNFSRLMFSPQAMCG